MAVEATAVELARALMERVERKVDDVKDDVHAMRIELAETRGQNLRERVEVLEAGVAELRAEFTREFTRWTAYVVAGAAILSLLISVAGLALTAVGVL